MEERPKKRSLHYILKFPKKPGTAPGTLISPHDNDGEETSIRVFACKKDKISVEENVTASKLAFTNHKTCTWVDVAGLRNLKALELIGKTFKLHPLLLEDVTHTNQRPKFDVYDGTLYIAARMFKLSEEKEISSEQISIVIGKNFLISFQEKKDGTFNSVRERLMAGKNPAHFLQPAYIAYSLLDTIVDHYFTILEDIGERIESMEEELVKRPEPKSLRSINRLKQESLILRRSIWPLRDVLNRFDREESALVSRETHVYIRDLYDHAVQVIEAIETYRDVLSGMVDLYLSSVSNKMNAIMKVLTIISTIFIPLTFLAGVYGMNFKYMPEIGWHYGYPVVLAVMVSAVIFMLLYFKRKGWFQ